MGGEGHIFAMISSLKNNSRRRRSSYDNLENVYVKKRRRPLRFRNISEKELNSIRIKIRRERRVEYRLSLIGAIIGLSIISVGLYFLLTRVMF